MQEPYNITHLDDLLASYLELLDTYTRQRDDLSAHLSSGFFRLAQAQRSSMLPPGQRYGKEMYDERMKAGRRARLQRGTDAGAERERARLELHQYTEVEAAKPSPQTEKTPAPASPTETLKESRKSAKSSPDLPASEQPPPETATSTNPKANTRKTKDPLHWFGILTPQPLRACQSSFVSALGTVPTLINISRAMAELEAEIERVRKSLGLNVETEDDVVVDDEDTVAEAKQKADARIYTSHKQRSLTSRSKVAEPRSRVLKLGIT